jgi:hypothetical protein
MKIIGLFAFLAAGLAVSTLPESSPRRAATYEVEKHTFTYAPDSRPIQRKTFTNEIYFSQSYFEHSSYEYDPHLATASMCLSISSSTDYGPWDAQWYANQPKFLQKTLEAIGFDSFLANDDYRSTARFDSIGLAAAKRKFSDYTVIAVTPRSGGYYSEWANNMHLGDGTKSDYMHEGWYNAANKMIDFARDYATTYQVSGRVKLWLTGFSRGGATANIAAGLIDSKLDRGERIFTSGASLKREDVFAYTFEAPQGANVNSKTIKLPRDAIYGNIFNIVNPNDVVPKVAMSEYGFTRFGIDKFITTRFFDPDHFAENRRNFRALHDIANQTDELVYSADNFGMYGLKIEDFLKMITIVPALIDVFEGDFGNMKDNTKANYDANIATTLFIEELTSDLGSRADYVKKYQKSIEDLMLILQDEKAGVMPSMPSLAIKMILISVVSNSLLGHFDSVNKYVDGIAGAHAKAISKAIGSLVGPLSSAYWERPNELISIAVHIGDILQNHCVDITLAHVQAQDSYYIDAYNASHSNKISLVPFRDNADIGRMKFFGFNDLGLRLDSKKGHRVVNVEGHTFGKSDVEDCEKGYAVGYYSYVTEEKMELFMPVGRTYNISMKSYSKKPRHRCEYWAYYQFIALDNRGAKKVQLDHKKDTAYFNSDRFKRDVTVKI